MAAAVQPPMRVQILMKMEASASSATSIEKNEPPAAWPSTLSTRVLQLPADGHHLDGHICSSLSFAAAAPTCSPATKHVHVSTEKGGEESRVNSPLARS